ncbi:transglycosylase family protein [Streptomyces sp. XD-27]|uniref:transglycosylase family protein n=1 Tax=Streptomyces sp. XD-27 TaxID=3062779 RepID=UPI0026F41556|nr:transglycosylase family protein [Streptomyces sp. XD-27]WKX70757.1 transglycosylase family protein [Streptomyces sp. XD-27]
MRSGNGRHRRPRQAPAIVVAAGVTGASIALPLLGATGAHAADTATWDRVAECESGGMWSANAGNGFYGGLQLTLDMWKSYGGTSYAPRPDLASRSQQISVAESILADRGPQAWPGCALNAGLKDGGDAPEVNPGSTEPPRSGAEEPDGGDADSTKPADEDTSTEKPDSDSGSDDTSDADRDRTDGDADGKAPEDGKGDKDADGEKGDKADEDGKGSTDRADGKDPERDSDSAPKPSEDPADGRTDDGKGDGGDESKGDGKAPSPDAGRTPEPGSGRHRGAPDDRADDGERRGGRHASRGDRDRGANPAGDGPKRYTVRSGDSLSAIAAEHDVPGGWPALYEANESLVGTDPDLIHPGQRLVLDGGER